MQIIPRSALRSLSTVSQSRLPWFVDPAPPLRQHPPHMSAAGLPPLPAGIPPAIKELHASLRSSPHLEPSELLVCEPIPTPPGPPLPDTLPKGRRKRGRTYAGEGVGGTSGGIWSWIVIAQVKEGAEDRGAIESVVRVVRKSLLQMQPPLQLPPNSKRHVGDGWAMVDAGEFAVHVLSREARAKFFPPGRREF